MKKLLKSSSAAITIFMIIFQGITGACFGVAPSNTDEKVKEKLNQILMKDEIYNQKIKTGNPWREVGDLVSRAKNFLKEKFLEFLENIFNLSNFDIKKMSSLNWVFYSISFILLILGFVILALFLRKYFRKKANLKMQEDAEILENIRDYSLLEAKAIEMFDSGEYRSAIRLFYLALLLWFNDRNMIRIDRSKTNRQYLKELEFYYPQIYKQMLDFTVFFNGAWYGDKKVEFDKAQYWMNNYLRIVQERTYENE